MTRTRTPIGPLVVDRMTTSNALARIDGLIRHGRGGFVVNPNAEQLMLAERLPRLREAYRKSSLSIAQGQSLRWMSLALRRPIPERISGVDFLLNLAEHAAARDYGVFLVGSSEAVSAKVAEQLQARFPGLRIVGRDTSAWPHSHPQRLMRRIRESGAKIVLVGHGCPVQEAWMLQHSEHIQPAVAFGVTSGFEKLAAEAKSAPRWMSRIGLAWSYHYVCTPCRVMHRYVVEHVRIAPLFLRVLVARLRGVQRRPITLPV